MFNKISAKPETSTRMPPGLDGRKGTRGSTTKQSIPRTLAEIEDEYRIKDYEQFLSQIHPDFCRRLLNRAPAITPMELRVCILARAFVGIKESASILSISKSSVESHRSHAREKLRIGERSISLISVLHSI